MLLLIANSHRAKHLGEFVRLCCMGRVRGFLLIGCRLLRTGLCLFQNFLRAGIGHRFMVWEDVAGRSLVPTARTSGKGYSGGRGCGRVHGALFDVALQAARGRAACRGGRFRGLCLRIHISLIRFAVGALDDFT